MGIPHLPIAAITWLWLHLDGGGRRAIENPARRSVPRPQIAPSNYTTRTRADSLNDAELANCPGMLAAHERYDTNKDGKSLRRKSPHDSPRYLAAASV